MGQYNIALSMPGGFQSIADAKAHRNVISKLQQYRDLANETAEDMRGIDRAEIGATPSDLYTDLAAGKGHVIILSQPEGKPVLGAELSYNVNDNSTTNLVMDFGDSKLSHYGSTYRLEEGEGKEKVTTYFRFNESDKTPNVAIYDPESDKPRIFGEADPDKLTRGVIQRGTPDFIILG